MDIAIWGLHQGYHGLASQASEVLASLVVS